MTTKVAVLGASSFSGAAFVAYARAHGCEVLPLSRSDGFDLNHGLPQIREACDAFKPEWFVNFAALNVVAQSWVLYPDYYRTNVIGVARLADSLARAPWLERFIQVSTPEVYGNEAGSISDPLKPGAPFAPSTPYAVSRAAADYHLAALHRTFGFPVCFTRTVNVYGSAQQPYRIIPKTVLKVARGEKLKLEGGGYSERSFIHIRDVAAGILAVARSGRAGATYHFATPQMVPIRNLVSEVCARLGVAFDDSVEDAPERPGKDRAYVLDWELSKRELGWHPTIDIEDGLDETVAWFKAHANDYAADPLEYQHRP